MIIKIKNLHLKTILGIYKWEESFDREIIINAKITTDSEESTKTNDIKDTIDYDIIIEKIKNFVTTNKFRLIEKMAADIIDLILTDKRIKECELEVDKVGVIEGVDSFSITLTKKN